MNRCKCLFHNGGFSGWRIQSSDRQHSSSIIFLKATEEFQLSWVIDHNGKIIRLTTGAHRVISVRRKNKSTTFTLWARHLLDLGKGDIRTPILERLHSYFGCLLWQCVHFEIVFASVSGHLPLRWQCLVVWWLLGRGRLGKLRLWIRRGRVWLGGVWSGRILIDLFIFNLLTPQIQHLTKVK